MSEAREFRHNFRIYYEDTDCMGVVYHANYLRFFERARTELMRESGASVVDWQNRGLMFPIYSINVVFKNPARLGDEIRVISKPKALSAYRFGFDQRLELAKDGKLLVTAAVEVVCTDLAGSLQTLPELGFV